MYSTFHCANTTRHSRSRSPNSASAGTSPPHQTPLTVCPSPAILPEPESESDSDSDLSVEELDSDEWEEWGEGEGIPPTSCLFCPHRCPSLKENLGHMTRAHSFFVPDVEYVTDMAGLLNYLGQKVSYLGF